MVPRCPLALWEAQHYRCGTASGRIASVLRQLGRVLAEDDAEARGEGSPSRLPHHLSFLPEKLPVTCITPETWCEAFQRWRAYKSKSSGTVIVADVPLNCCASTAGPSVGGPIEIPGIVVELYPEDRAKITGVKLEEEANPPTSRQRAPLVERVLVGHTHRLPDLTASWPPPPRPESAICAYTSHRQVSHNARPPDGPSAPPTAR